MCRGQSAEDKVDSVGQVLSLCCTGHGYSPVIAIRNGAGFSMVEIQTLVSGFDETAPLGVRWRTLAEQKLAELDVLISKAQGMKRVLEEGMRCQCLNLDECLPLEAGRCL